MDSLLDDEPAESGSSCEVAQDGHVNIQQYVEIGLRQPRENEDCSVERRFTAWLVNQKRPMTMKEMCRLQGIDPSSMVLSEGITDLESIVAKSPSLNVMERLMLRILKAAGMIHTG